MSAGARRDGLNTVKRRFLVSDLATDARMRPDTMSAEAIAQDLGTLLHQTAG
jgi:hypothetical protein